MRALDDVDLVVEAGSVHCVLGENGAGKSTLCHLVGGSLTPDAGSLRLYGEAYAPRRPADALAAGVAMVHQHFSLVPTLTVGENLRLLRLPGLAGRVARVREEYGLELELDAVVGELPVGVRQRVEIVKALLRTPLQRGAEPAATELVVEMGEVVLAGQVRVLDLGVSDHAAFGP
ncbi:ATP-binding cassette domain-containing protein, partial [Streptomyces coryli]